MQANVQSPALLIRVLQHTLQHSATGLIGTFVNLASTQRQDADVSFKLVPGRHRGGRIRGSHLGHRLAQIGHHLLGGCSQQRIAGLAGELGIRPQGVRGGLRAESVNDGCCMFAQAVQNIPFWMVIQSGKCCRGRAMVSSYPGASASSRS